MDDATLIKALNTFAARIVFLECQVIALRRLLDKSSVVPDEEFETMLSKAIAASQEVLNPQKDASERLAEFLRTFEGPKQ